MRRKEGQGNGWARLVGRSLALYSSGLNSSGRIFSAPKKFYPRFGTGFGVEKLLLEQVYGAYFRVALRNWKTKPITRAFPITKRQL